MNHGCGLVGELYGILDRQKKYEIPCSCKTVSFEPR